MGEVVSLPPVLVDGGGRSFRPAEVVLDEFEVVALVQLLEGVQASGGDSGVDLVLVALFREWLVARSAEGLG